MLTACGHQVPRGVLELVSSASQDAQGCHTASSCSHDFARGSRGDLSLRVGAAAEVIDPVDVLRKQIADTIIDFTHHG